MIHSVKTTETHQTNLTGWYCQRVAVNKIGRATVANMMALIGTLEFCSLTSLRKARRLVSRAWQKEE